jgi:hypothetical protein
VRKTERTRWREKGRYVREIEEMRERDRGEMRDRKKETKRT